MSLLIEELLRLLQIDSTIGNEAEICNYVESEISKLNVFHTYRVNHSLISLYQTKHQASKTIAFYGHLDTVDNQQDQPPYQKEERIYGCGASDMKSGLAVMLELMRKTSQITPSYNLIFVFYEMEEGPYETNGLELILEQYSPQLQCDLAFAMEPTDNRIQVGCLGGIHARILFEGKSAHSARPWHGENAIHKAWPLLKTLTELEPVPIHFQQLTFYEVMNMTLASGGQTRNSIPASFEFNLNYRFAPGKKLEEAKQEIKELIGEQAQIEFVDESPSGPVILDNLALQEFQNQFHLPIEPKQAWTDVARLALYRIPAVNFGPGATSQAHQKNEWVASTKVEQSYKMLEEFIFRTN